VAVPFGLTYKGITKIYLYEATPVSSQSLFATKPTEQKPILPVNIGWQHIGVVLAGCAALLAFAYSRSRHD
jgi:hypothetical protein